MRGRIVRLARRTFGTMANEYVAGTHSMAFVTVPNMEVAKKLSHKNVLVASADSNVISVHTFQWYRERQAVSIGIVNERLAACVNIIPAITSVYEWEGKINEDPELLLMIKTQTDKVPELSEYVSNNHPYDCPEVISSKIDDGNAPYLKWIGEVMSSSKPLP